MDIHTQSHLADLRAALLYRLNELRSDIHAAELARQSQREATHEVTDRKDDAGREQLGVLDSAQSRRDLEEQADIEAALHRLDTGIYGDCADCGAPIGFERLLAQPAALRCAPCQAEHEHGQATGPGRRVPSRLIPTR